MKTIVITGGNDGIGQALAEKLSKSAKVVILARNELKLKEIAEATGCEWYVCDVKDASQVARVIDKIAESHGGIDILINNAGIIVNGDLTETSYEIIEDVITTNSLGSIYVAKATLAHMKKQKQGLIINVISQAGITAKPYRSIYNASKWAVTGFTKAIQQEAAEYGVRVTGFFPGTTNTELFSKAGLDLNTNAMDTNDIIGAIEYIMSVPESITVPEFGIKPTLQI